VVSQLHVSDGILTSGKLQYPNFR